MVTVSRSRILHTPAQTLFNCPALISLTCVLVFCATYVLGLDSLHVFSLAFSSHLEVGHVSVALLRACVIRQLDVPEAGQLVHQEGVLFDHSVEDILQSARPTSHIPLHQLQTDLAALSPPTHYA